MTATVERRKMTPAMIVAGANAMVSGVAGDAIDCWRAMQAEALAAAPAPVQVSEERIREIAEFHFPGRRIADAGYRAQCECAIRAALAAPSQSARREGHSALRGRPLDEDGNIELTKFDPHPAADPEHGALVERLRESAADHAERKRQYLKDYSTAAAVYPVEDELDWIAAAALEASRLDAGYREKYILLSKQHVREVEELEGRAESAERRNAELTAELERARADERERCINALSKEYADPERFGPDADCYNSAVGYCIGALRALPTDGNGEA